MFHYLIYLKINHLNAGNITQDRNVPPLLKCSLPNGVFFLPIGMFCISYLKKELDFPCLPLSCYGNLLLVKAGENAKLKTKVQVSKKCPPMPVRAG